MVRVLRYSNIVFYDVAPYSSDVKSACWYTYSVIYQKTYDGELIDWLIGMKN